jgi:hypothetical protein
MDRPSSATVKRLFALSRNCCAFPGCDHPLIEPLSQKVVGRICHIKARSENGPRFDPIQTAEERHDFANLVLMCPTHHDVIDHDVATYPVARLIAIKREHESQSTEPDRADLPEQTIQQLIATISFSQSITQSNYTNTANTIQNVVQGDGHTINMNFGNLK